MSQPEIAKVLEVSDGTVKNIELGKREPKRSELLAIAEACNVPMWFLEGGWDGWRSVAEIDALGHQAVADLSERNQRKGREAG